MRALAAGCGAECAEVGGVKVGDYLTGEEVRQLPEGVFVEVVWSGGNGPHRYRLIREGERVCVDTIYRDALDIPGTIVALPPTPLTTVRLVGLPEKAIEARG